MIWQKKFFIKDTYLISVSFKLMRVVNGQNMKFFEVRMISEK